MTTETGCRVSVEELRHDRYEEARSRKIDALQKEMLKQFNDGLTAGEIAEAAMVFAYAENGRKAVKAHHEKDYAELGYLFSAAINCWVSLQAVKEVDRMIERGEV